MSKGFGGKRGMMPRGGGAGMAQQIQKLQDEMRQAQEALGQETVEASVGGGVIKVVMTGHLEVRSVEIAPEVVSAEDVEMLQDLIVAAVNEAIVKAQALAAERMSALTGGLNLPGLF
ncbi:MAG: YbaB/EbfC family nucleoid-associated protein [Anaerolineae bacterium]